MKTETLERIVIGILEGKTRRELADRAEVTLDDLGKVTKDKCFSNLEYYKHKADARQDLFQAPDVDKILFEFEYDFPKKCNRYTRYDEKTGEPLPKKEQPPTHHLFESLRKREQSSILFLQQLVPNRAIFNKALDDISMPWRSINNWTSLVLQRTDSDGNIILSLQDSIPYDLMGAVLVAITEMNRPEGNKSLEPTSPAIRPPQPYRISDECPYKNKNSSYAVIWQILYEHPDGIDRRTLQTKAMDVTGKKKKTVSDYVPYVISPKDPEGKGRHKRAKPGYWVERLADKKLKLRILRGRNAEAR